VGGAIGAASRSPSAGPALLETARLAFTHALQTTLSICAAIAIAAAIVVLASSRGSGRASAILDGVSSDEDAALSPSDGD
jgi:hypothetical protein